MSSHYLEIFVLSLAVFMWAQGREVCQVRWKGKMNTFSNVNVNVKIPCKYRATHLFCDGYEVGVSPGQALDEKGRYFTDTVWVSIKKVGTPYVWEGRTSTKIVHRYFNTTGRTPFNTKLEMMTGAPFGIHMSSNENDYSVTVKTSDADFEVTFNAYDRHNDRLMANNGVRISCAKPTYPPQSSFPKSMCGNGTSKTAIRNRRKELGTASRTKTVIYDILNSNVKQTKPECETATSLFKSCPSDKLAVVQDCSVLIHRSNIVKCLTRDSLDPMTSFVHCLKYRCFHDPDSCFLLQEALDGCPQVDDLAPKHCPSTQ